MAYTNSSLVDYTKLSPNNSGLRKHSIDTITIHCVVGQCSVQTLGSIFSKPSYQASANYGIGYDGKIGMYVEEKNRSWCSSSPENDNRAITIEVASDTKHPYAVNDKAYSTLIKLATDICKRNGIKKLVWSTSKNTRVNHLNGCNMTVHRDYANKSCVPVDTEVLTKSGWIKLSDINIGDEIACADLDNLRITFEEVYDKVEPYKHDTYTSNGFTATKDHRVVYFLQKSKNINRIQSYAECLSAAGGIYLPMAGHFNGEGLPLTEDMIKFLTAVQADGHYMHETRKDNTIGYYGVEFHFKKERKINRITEILDNLNLPYNISKISDGSTKIRIYNYDGINIVTDICEKYLKDKCFTWNWINLDPEQAKVFLSEILLWDGCTAANSYTSSKQINVDVVSAVAALNNFGGRVTGNTIQFRTEPYTTLGETVRNSKQHDTAKNLVSCISVKTGIFLCRQNGKTFITGNCPGDYLYNRMGQIAKEVNANLSATKPETSKPSTKPSTSSKLKFKVGDIIQFKGGAVYTTSGGSKSSGNATAGKAKVTVIAEGTKHPYHIIHEDKNSTVYGWVNAGNVLSLTEESKPSTKPSTSKPSTSKPSTSKPQSKKKVIIEDGIWGKNTNIYTQKHFGTEVDGIISGQKTGAKKYLQSIEASAWQFKLLGKGSPVAKKIQSLVGVKADGFIGPDTIKAIQKYLSAKGYYTGKVDGIMGVNTVKGWQKLVNSWF